MPFMKIRALLLQARNNGDLAKDEEQQSFAVKMGVPPDRVIPFDLLEGVPSLSEVRNYDALLVGGAGEYYVSKGNLPHFKKLLDLLAEVSEVGHPTFASCFGFQCIVVALGGQIIHDKESTQVGTYVLNLTDEGKADSLLGSLPPAFSAQLGRKDRALELPPGIPNLASSDKCPYQAFRIPGKPVWAFQFHPELDAAENKLRFRRYMQGYSSAMNPREFEEVLHRFSESPETEGLLQQFMKIVFGSS